ncbi:hypothetical protein TNCV_2079381 [Trichonephila clavipes]|nr:hypothetical protein TNCV_2079381 [Trichonephila clavipes]
MKQGIFPVRRSAVVMEVTCTLMMYLPGTGTLLETKELKNQPGSTPIFAEGDSIRPTKVFVGVFMWNPKHELLSPPSRE